MSFDGQLPGQYSLLRDLVLNPRQQNSIVRVLPIGTTEILPAPPAGYAWWVSGDYAAPGGASTYTLSTAAAIVDGGTIPGGTMGGFNDGTFLDGGLCTLAAVSVVVAGAPLAIAFQVALMPSDRIRPFISQGLTDSYQVVALPAIDDGEVLVQVDGPYPANYYGNFARWGWNGNAAGNLEFTYELTRGSNVIELQGSSTNPKQRVYSAVPPMPPLRNGDVLRAKVDVAPTGVAPRFGMMFMVASKVGGF